MEEERGNVVGVDISMKSLNYFDSCSFVLLLSVVKHRNPANNNYIKSKQKFKFIYKISLLFNMLRPTKKSYICKQIKQH